MQKFSEYICESKPKMFVLRNVEPMKMDKVYKKLNKMGYNIDANYVSDLGYDDNEIELACYIEPGKKKVYTLEKDGKSTTSKFDKTLKKFEIEEINIQQFNKIGI